jgi:hypothetical protein
MAEIKYDTTPSIAKQIENTADYFPPATYSGTGYAYGVPASYLTYYNELVVAADTLSEQFVPLSSVPSKGRNPKLFAIGVIPPSANISGRLLSRTSTVNNLVTPVYDQKAGNAGAFPPYPGKLKPLTVDQKNQMFGKFSYTPNPTANNPEGVKITDDWAAKNLVTVDIPQLAKFGSSQATFHKAVASQFQAFFKGIESAGLMDQLLSFGGSYNPRFVRGSNSTLSPHAWGTAVDINQGYNPLGQKPVAEGVKGSTVAFVPIANSVGLVWGGTFGRPDAMHFEAGAIYDVPAPDLLPSSQAVEGDNSTAWDQNAAAAANDAQRFLEKLANTPLTSEDIGSQFTAAQTAQIKVIKDAVEAMANTPPLRLLVNPQSFSTKGEKIVSDSGWSRNGATIIEHWGNGQEKISASGKVAGFFAADIANSSGPGITRMARNASQSWQNFQSLQLFYANNGGIYTTDATSSTLERNLTMVGSIYIYYDSILYMGAFDSFTVTESDTTPHTVDYSFEFTVRAAFLLDSPDPNGDPGAAGARSRQTPSLMVQG